MSPRLNEQKQTMAHFNKTTSEITSKAIVFRPKNKG